MVISIPSHGLMMSNDLDNLGRTPHFKKPPCVLFFQVGKQGFCGLSLKFQKNLNDLNVSVNNLP